MESTESKIPPRPGIMFPLSLITADLLNTDSIRSPVIPAAAQRNPIKAPFNGEP